MSKSTLSLAMPEALTQYIDGRVAGGGYGNRSEYIRELVRRDQREQAAQRLRTLIEEGLASGRPTVDTEEDWNELRRIARARRR